MPKNALRSSKSDFSKKVIFWAARTRGGVSSETEYKTHYKKNEFLFKTTENNDFVAQRARIHKKKKTRHDTTRHNNNMPRHDTTRHAQITWHDTTRNKWHEEETWHDATRKDDTETKMTRDDTAKRFCQKREGHNSTRKPPFSMKKKLSANFGTRWCRKTHLEAPNRTFSKKWFSGRREPGEARLQKQIITKLNFFEKHYEKQGSCRQARTYPKKKSACGVRAAPKKQHIYK